MKSGIAAGFGAKEDSVMRQELLRSSLVQPWVTFNIVYRGL